VGRQRRIPQVLTGETRSVIAGIFPPSQGWMFQTVALTRFAPRRSLLVFRRVRDLREALKAANDMGLTLTCPRSVTDRVLGLLLPHLADDGGEI